MSAHRWIPKKKSIPHRLPVLHEDVKAILRGRPPLPHPPLLGPELAPAHAAVIQDGLTPNEACHLFGAMVTTLAARNIHGQKYRALELAGALAAYQLTERGEALTARGIIREARQVLSRLESEAESLEASK